jgi:2'-5' RNA ligase
MAAAGKTARLFVALTPPPELLARVGELQAHLRQVLPARSLRWTRPEQSHLTLRFLGSVALSRLEDLTASLTQATASIPTLELELRGLGVFPNLRRPRVLWIGVEESTGTLLKLQAAVVSATVAFTVEPPEKHYHPHLTLARLQLPVPELPQVLEKQVNSEVLIGSWQAVEMELVQSHLAAEGARYETLTRLPLGHSGCK